MKRGSMASISASVGRLSERAGDLAFGIVAVAALAPAGGEAVESCRRPWRRGRSWSPRPARWPGCRSPCGSSVPAWPAFWASKMRRTAADGLGRGHAHRLVQDDPAMDRVTLLACGPSVVLLPCVARFCRSRATLLGTAGCRSIFWASAKTVVFDKAQLGRELHGDAWAHLAAQESLVAVQRRHDLLGVLARPGARNRRWHSACRATA